MSAQWLGLAVLLVFALVMAAFGLSARRRAASGKPPWELRELGAFTKLAHGIGLAVEAGQRLHLSLGRGGIFGLPGASTFLGLSVLNRVARSASISDHPPVATGGEAVQAILARDILQRAHALSAAETAFDPTSAQLTGLTPFSFAAGALPTVFDQNAAVNVLTGSFGPEAGLIADAVDRTGGMMLAGSEDLAAQAVFYASTPDILVGEELYAAGAYLQAGPSHNAGLAAQDVIRYGVIAVLIIGSILKLAGIL